MTLDITDWTRKLIRYFYC